ncbi:glycosyltransferase [Phaeodactylibacter luteus]|uniref:Glycosyltransferase n=1 Tax=Phaeodactylibacter luteus TaxID=1564516 RepID=A0A5C6RPE9_9BACT|nr:glycosyltransferase [Phaeodactylibacter luteus]TXB63815.1 glycosyltransferase [Phaeodactylibacter luteus]
MANPLGKALLLTDWFAPGYRAGGPISSTVNLVKGLSPNMPMLVVTGDRDLGDTQPYEGIRANHWVAYEGTATQVQYLSPADRRKRIRTILRQHPTLPLYLNSMFSPDFTLWPLWLHLRGAHRGKVVLAPRGMLRSSALAFKPIKKKLLLSLLHTIGLQRRICFHATDATEAKDIRSVFGPAAKVVQLSNFPVQPEARKPVKAAPAPAWKLLFVGRIHPIKGLLHALQVLQYISHPVELTIIGPMEDPSYWKDCEAAIQKLPANISVSYAGEQPPPKVKDALLAHHFFILPTHGENFGHAIFEALATGTPVLISDQTPWRWLKKHKAGWDLPLSEPEAWKTALHHALTMTAHEYEQWSRSAHRFAKEYFAKQDLVSSYKKLFSK